MYFGECQTRVSLALKLINNSMKEGRNMTCGGLNEIIKANPFGDWFLVYNNNKIFWRPAIPNCCHLCNSLIEEDTEELGRFDIKIYGKVRTL